MKKSIILAMVVMMVMASCESGITEEAATSAKTAKVHVNLSGFKIETTTRTTTADSVGVTGIAFAVIDQQGQIIDSVQQAKGSEGFDSVSFELTEGTYTFVAEAHIVSNLASISVSDGKALATIKNDAVYDIYTASEQVTVKAGEDINLRMTLSRITAQLSLVTSDSQPKGVKKLQFFIGDTTKTAYSAFSIDLATGTMDGFGITGHLKREWGRTSKDTCKATTQDCSLLLAAVEQSLPVKIVVRGDADSILYSHAIDSVPFKQNCKTTITGKLYTTKKDCKSTFEFDTVWKDTIYGDW